MSKRHTGVEMKEFLNSNGFLWAHWLVYTPIFTMFMQSRFSLKMIFHIHKQVWHHYYSTVVQMTLDGKQLSISGATGYTYTCQTENINSHLFVSCEPTRSDGVKGPVVISQHVGPVLSGESWQVALDISLSWVIFWWFSRVFVGHKLLMLLNYMQGKDHLVSAFLENPIIIK